MHITASDMFPPHTITAQQAAKERIISEKSSEKCMIFRAFSYSKYKKARLFSALPPSKERTGKRLVIARNNEHIPQKTTTGFLNNGKATAQSIAVAILKNGPASDIKKSCR